MALDNKTNMMVSNLIERVNTAFKNAKGKWSGNLVTLGGVFTGTNPKQVLNAIRQMEVEAQKWSERGLSMGISRDSFGQAKIDQWVQFGNDLLKNLADIAQDSEVVKLDRIVIDTAKATVADAAVIAKETVKIGTGLAQMTTWVVIGLGALFIFSKVKSVAG